MKKSNTIVSIILILFGIYLYFVTYSWDPSTVLFPRLLLLSLMFLSVLLAFIKGITTNKKSDSSNLFEKTNIVRLLIVILSILAYIKLIPLLGFYICTSIFLAVMLYYGKLKNIYILLIVVVIFIISFYGIFSCWLKVPIP